MSNSLELVSQHASCDGTVRFFRHQSAVNQCEMRFSVFVPPEAENSQLPMLTYLAGLTCTEETFMIKAGAQRVAADLGLILVAPDTSPRGEGVPDDPDGAYDFGLGAGFYLNATEEPWRRNYNMYDYVTRELQVVMAENFPVDVRRQGVFGHSMGGHGALTIGLKNPQVYRSISAFAPICSPINCPWGQKALSNYLGSNQDSWLAYDATTLIESLENRPEHPILIDQGLADQFLETELHPHLLEKACATKGVSLQLRRHADYDHGYYFISTFIDDHLRFHATNLQD